MDKGKNSNYRGVDSFLNRGGGVGSSVNGKICPLWFEQGKLFRPSYTSELEKRKIFQLKKRKYSNQKKEIIPIKGITYDEHPKLKRDQGKQLLSVEVSLHFRTTVVRYGFRKRKYFNYRNENVPITKRKILQLEKGFILIMK